MKDVVKPVIAPEHQGLTFIDTDRHTGKSARMEDACTMIGGTVASRAKKNGFACESFSILTDYFRAHAN